MKTMTFEEWRDRLANVDPPPDEYVQLTQPCLSRIFKTYLRAGTRGRVLRHLEDRRLMIRFGIALIVIPEDSSLIEVVK
jgi:hypothetical protein